MNQLRWVLIIALATLPCAIQAKAGEDCEKPLVGLSTAPHTVAISRLAAFFGERGSAEFAQASQLLRKSYELDADGGTPRTGKQPDYARKAQNYKDFFEYFAKWFLVDVSVELQDKLDERERKILELTPLIASVAKLPKRIQDRNEFERSLVLRTTARRIERELGELTIASEELAFLKGILEAALEEKALNQSNSSFFSLSYNHPRVKRLRKIFFAMGVGMNGRIIWNSMSYYRLYGELRSAHKQSLSDGKDYLSIELLNRLLRWL